MSKMNASFSNFWGNPWTRTVLPLVAVGALSWAGLRSELNSVNSSMAGMELSLDKSHTEARVARATLSKEVQYLKREQAKDTEFRESGDHITEADALKMELRLHNQFSTKISEMMKMFSEKLDNSQKEIIRRMERLEEKVDKANERNP